MKYIVTGIAIRGIEHAVVLVTSCKVHVTLLRHGSWICKVGYYRHGMWRVLLSFREIVIVSVHDQVLAKIPCPFLVSFMALPEVPLRDFAESLHCLLFLQIFSKLCSKTCIYFMYMRVLPSCLYAYCMHARCPWRPECQGPWNSSCEPSHECWEENSSSQKNRQYYIVLLNHLFIQLGLFLTGKFRKHRVHLVHYCTSKPITE